MSTYPLLMVEQAFRAFMDQWNIGLKPILMLKTNDDGAIAICSEVTSFMPASVSSKSKRCGIGSRQRRREARAVKTQETAAEQAVPIIHSVEDAQTGQHEFTPPEIETHTSPESTASY